MTDSPRPAPQYGEYATPEVQQELMRRAGGDIEKATVPVDPVIAAAAGRTPAGAAARADTGVASEGDTLRPRRHDRFITIALLAYGLYTVVTSLPQLIDYTSFAQMWIEMAGIDAQFTATAAGRTWGLAAALLFAGVWIATALLSWWAIARRRISWWIPVAGAAVAFLLVSICLSVPLFNDPAVMEGVLTLR